MAQNHFLQRSHNERIPCQYHQNLPLGLDNEGLKQEAFALKCFAGCGAVKVLAEDEGMLLLERAVPGTSLKDYFPNREHESIEIACNVMKKLHQANIPSVHNFPHIKDWLTALDKDWSIPDEHLQKARMLRDQLLQTSEADVLLHGDLYIPVMYTWSLYPQTIDD